MGDFQADTALRRPVRWGEPLVERISESDFVLPVGTVTLLLADVEGSTRRWEADREAMAETVARYDEIVDEAVGRHQGVRPVEQGEGDSFVAAFSRASDALACALEIQRRLVALGLAVRMALHTGEVQLRDEGNYIGTTVNRCARIRALAHGGQTLLSGPTHDLVLDRLPDDVSLTDVGRHQLRDLARPEHLYQLCHPDLMADFPPLRSLDRTPHNLPTQLTTFIGRESELRQVATVLGEARLLTLTGPGGCGKTRLALQVAADVIDLYPDGVWFCDLSALTDASLVAQAVAAALSLPETPGRTFTQTLVDHLRELSALVVLDNCEHLVAASAALAEALLEGCPGLTVLATSRETLGVPGETAWRVPSLSLPAEGEPTLVDRVGQYDAVALFVDRARKSRPNFAVTNDTCPAVAQICHRLDGIPLAIELAAARVKVLTVEQIAAGLDDRFHLLGAGPRTAVPRQQTLSASVDWSHELLSETESVLFRRLAVFVGTFDLDAAEAVGAADPIDAYQVLAVLSDLVDKSLVVVDESGTTARYRLLETMRQYGTDRLVAAGEAPATRDRHLAYYVSMAERAFASFAGGVLGSDALELAYVTPSPLAVDYGNFGAALEWAMATAPADTKLRLTALLTTLWVALGLYTEGRGWLDRALDGCEDAQPRLRARALWSSGVMSHNLGDLDRARERIEAAWALGHEIGDRKTVNLALWSLYNLTGLQGDFERHRSVSDEIAASIVGDEADLSPGELRTLGVARLGHLEFNEARRLLARSIEASRQAGQPALIGALWNFGLLALAQGDFDVAIEAWLEVGERCGRARARFQAEMAEWVLAGLALATGDLDGAEARAVRLSEATQATGSLYHAAAESARAAVAYARGDLGAANAHAERARRALHGMGGAYAGIIRGCEPLLLVAAGNLTEARTLGNRLIEESGPLILMAVWNALPLVACTISRLEGDVDAAEAGCHQVLEQCLPAAARPPVANTLDILAGLAGDRESWIESTRLLAAGQALRDQLGYFRPAVEQARVDADVDRVRNQLSAEEFDRAWAEGTAMTWEEAVAYARRGRGERKRPSTGWASLTPTELSVARLVAEGLSNAEIAGRLFIAASTVKSHLGHIFTKLGISGRAELAAESVRHGVE